MKNNVKMGVYTFKGNESTFNFYTSLSAVDKVRFVNAVCSNVVDTNYNSIIRDLIFDFELINVFTDVDIDYIIKSDAPLDLMEELVEETKIVAIIKANAKDGVIEELNKAVDDNIAYLTGIHKNPIVEGLSNLLNTIEKKLADIDTSEMMKAAQMITSMTGELSTDNMLDSYAKSDMFKNKYKEILAIKEKHNDEMDATGNAIKNVVKSGNKKNQASN